MVMVSFRLIVLPPATRHVLTGLLGLALGGARFAVQSRLARLRLGALAVRGLRPLGELRRPGLSTTGSGREGAAVAAGDRAPGRLTHRCGRGASAAAFPFAGPRFSRRPLRGQ